MVTPESGSTGRRVHAPAHWNGSSSKRRVLGKSTLFDPRTRSRSSASDKSLLKFRAYNFRERMWALDPMESLVQFTVMPDGRTIEEIEICDEGRAETNGTG